MLPVVIEFIFQKKVEEIIIDATPKLEEFEDLLLSITFPKWEGEYNHILQLNTCSLDNILAVIILNKNNIVKSLNLIGKFHLKQIFNHLYNLATNIQFDELRDYIALQIEIDLFVDETVLVNYYNFFGSECKIIQFLRTEDLCNDQYVSNFKCHQCTNTFTTTCMPGNIGRLTNNSESSLSRKLLPTKCKSSGSSEVIF